MNRVEARTQLVHTYQQIGSLSETARRWKTSRKSGSGRAVTLLRSKSPLVDPASTGFWRRYLSGWAASSGVALILWSRLRALRRGGAEGALRLGWGFPFVPESPWAQATGLPVAHELLAISLRPAHVCPRSCAADLVVNGCRQPLCDQHEIHNAGWESGGGTLGMMATNSPARLLRNRQVDLNPLASAAGTRAHDTASEPRPCLNQAGLSGDCLVGAQHPSEWS